ncbi:CGNR zinc finger domain-containing protein [Demequina sp. NBRC 110056]|uniref:CGNR zinc finger domain-containing protein n=1 Tax=Demequina sp. NBRC 110056 TaxID=1570345 RepID=UPI000A05E9A6|nr:CGNR zinc finger domain-containing protein [Demequina sp. NBRC 110056]
MVFAHDSAEALESAAFLANSELEPDTLTTHEELVAFFDEFHYSGSRPSSSDLEAVRAIRTRLRELFKSTRDGAVPLVNAILAEERALPRLVRHDGRDWHIHATSDHRPLAERILVETAMAVIDVIRADEFERFGRCELDDCDGIVLDLSRNRSRKYCSVTCTNRAAQAAYRARQAEEAS